MSWEVTEAFNENEIVNFGNKFLAGNGYMGYRGTLEEYGKKELVACNLLGLYDQQGDLWREPVNAPNGFFTKVAVGEEELSVLQKTPLEHNQSLNIRQGIHSRKTLFESSRGVVTIQSERLVSAADAHLLAMKYSISVAEGGEVTLLTGIDGDVWDINGPHLYHYQLKAKGNTVVIEAQTGELQKTVAVAETIDYPFDAVVEIIKTDKTIYREITFTAEPGKVYQIQKAIAVYTDNDGVATVGETAFRHSISCGEKGYSGIKAEHAAVWEKRWDISDVEITGDDEAQFALRYSIYQLLILAPYHSDRLSIPARGLSGQTYKGAVFWDTEMFMLPFFLHTNPEAAKNLMHYRVHTLEGARQKAQEYGFRGAFYAWESQEHGQDACSDYNVTDVFTGRPMRTYFRDKQVHISADVVYGLWQAYEFTGDDAILLDGGAEVIFECARFFYSYSYFKKEKKRYEVIDVIGPDEYHERVYNNVYTNRMVQHTLDTALKTYRLLEESYPEELAKLMAKIDFYHDLENIKAMREALFVPQPNEDTNLIEQFDGYFQLEDTTVEKVRSRLLDPKEYWGGAYGIASDTQILKQADVVLMLNLFKDEYSKEVKQDNWQYYEPRTEHGSSLSPCIYALLACDVGNQEWAYPYFMKTATVDLTGESKQFAGTIYIGGTHPAANGGAWMAAVQGFGGLKIVNDVPQVTPRLPEKWQRLAFKVLIKGQRYKIEITKEETQICKI